MTKIAVVFPGQGAQYKGMGRPLFGLFPEMVRQASEVLGYSIERLCLDDPERKLNQTQFTQPALYVVNALAYLKWTSDRKGGKSVSFFAGHSLGEYNALWAANAFDFVTGLVLVKKRGELMGAAAGGAMAAVLGVNAEEVKSLLAAHRLDDIDLANFNTPTQSVIAGRKESIVRAVDFCTAKGIRAVPLNVTAAFHSRFMQAAQKEFADFIGTISLSDPEVPVIANSTGSPYAAGEVARTLSEQIAAPVRWTDSIRYLMGQEVTDYQEVGATVLTKMITEITTTESPIVPAVDRTGRDPLPGLAGGQAQSYASPIPPASSEPSNAAAASQGVGLEERPAAALSKQPVAPQMGDVDAPLFTAEGLGSPLFRQRYGTRYAYVAGSMYRGIGSPEIVARMGKAGLIGFFGTGGLSSREITAGIQFIQSRLTQGESYGANLIANYTDPASEMRTIELLLQQKVRYVEAAAFMKMTPALVRFRLAGLSRSGQGRVVCAHHVIAKVSRPEVAENFMSPPPPAIVSQLLQDGMISSLQAELAGGIPVAHDICVEADSGGHTDGAIPTVVLPTMLRLRDELATRFNYPEPICMGQAGGIGTPEAAAAAFLMGADFILTGSINQCTVEAGMSAEVKALLQDINVQDTDYAPAGDMFEIGSKVQVLKKGVFFPSRANKLFSLYQHYDSLEDIPEKTIRTMEKTYFKKTIADIWEETKNHLRERGRTQEISRAETDKKHKMALVFRWYFYYTTKLAMLGDGAERVNFQVHTGPALGAFNQWVKGTPFSSWESRHVDQIAEMLMTGTARYLQQRFAGMLEANSRFLAMENGHPRKAAATAADGGRPAAFRSGAL